jgi:hypothetical protein
LPRLQIGVIYTLTVIVHARKSIAYQPDAEDWFWYAGLPVLAYIVLGVAAIVVWMLAGWSLFVIAAISVLFLFMGIRNSWDTVTYVRPTALTVWSRSPHRTAGYRLLFFDALHKPTRALI